MHLPELEWQLLYGRLAWAVVLAAVVAALLPAAWRSRTPAAGLLAVCAALIALPQEYSPAYWLVLAFQAPSAVLAGCCLLSLMPGKPGNAALPHALAVPVALTGAALYLDALGWLSLGLYYAGFGPYGAPVVAVAAAFASVFMIVRGRARAHALVVLGAVALYSIWRLPTGNLWDALIDPLLWGWAVVSLAAHGMRSVRQRRRAATAPA
ncbi:MAG TPA: hypothetical protein VGE60_12295 [Telluria sp.]